MPPPTTRKRHANAPYGTPHSSGPLLRHKRLFTTLLRHKRLDFA
jgi:hypothetical protein